MCKGVGAEVAGNCLSLIVAECTGGNKVVRLANLWVELLGCYADHRVPTSARLPHLTYEMFENGRNEFPCLSGCKGNHLKHLLGPLLTLLNRHTNGSEEMSQAIACVTNLIRFYEIIDGNRSFF